MAVVFAMNKILLNAQSAGILWEIYMKHSELWIKCLLRTLTDELHTKFILIKVFVHCNIAGRCRCLFSYV